MRNISSKGNNEEKEMNEGRESMKLFPRSSFKLMLALSTIFYNQRYAGQAVEYKSKSVG